MSKIEKSRKRPKRGHSIISTVVNYADLPKRSAPSDGRQVKIKLSGDMIASLQMMAKRAGEKKIQTVMRYIIAEYLQDQARAAGLDVQITPPHPAG